MTEKTPTFENPQKSCHGILLLWLQIMFLFGRQEFGLDYIHSTHCCDFDLPHLATTSHTPQAGQLEV